jgi:hypothetical protein
VREQFSRDGKYYACWRDPNYPYCLSSLSKSSTLKQTKDSQRERDARYWAHGSDRLSRDLG